MQARKCYGRQALTTAQVWRIQSSVCIQLIYAIGFEHVTPLMYRHKGGDITRDTTRFILSFNMMRRPTEELVFTSWNGAILGCSYTVDAPYYLTGSCL